MSSKITSKRSKRRASLLAAAVFGCSIASASSLDQELSRLIDEHGLDGEPAGYVDTDPAAPLPRLGRALFFSRQLSGDRDVACASCHHPLLGGSDGLSLPVGIGSHRPEIVGPGRLTNLSVDLDPKAATVGGPNVRRNSTTTFNSTLFQKALLFDGRVSLLEATDDEGNALFRTPESTLRSSPDVEASGDLVAVQARFPVVSFQEMRGFGEFYELTAAEVRFRIAERLRESDAWLRAFRLALGKPGATAEEVITFDNIARALGAYQQTQTFIDSPWRSYVRGYPDSITEQAKEGARLFFAEPEDGGFGCSGCHAGDLFSDESFHVAGFPQLGRGKRTDGDDPGRFLVSQEPEDTHKFRTPSLLNVEVTGPWGHAGSFDTLAGLVRYHANPVDGIQAFDFSLAHLPQLEQNQDAYRQSVVLTQRAVDAVSPKIPRKTPTDAEVQQLTAFLESLTDPCVKSRTCLQPWIANYMDDFDGHLLQPLFDTASQDFPFDVREPEKVQAETMPASLPVRLDRDAALNLAQCFYHEPRRPGTGERKFVDRTTEKGINHTHFVPGRMWYGSKYSFTVEFAMQSGAVAAGDLNGDCTPDLIFGTHDGERPLLLAYLSNDAGDHEVQTLELEGLPDAIGAIGLADLDGDYRLDLAVGNLFGARETAIYRAGENDTFELFQKISMSKVVFGFAFGDYSGDGWLDLFAAHWDIEARPAQAPALMRNAGGGHLLPADASAGTTGANLEQNFHFSPAFADFDADGDQDLVIASDFSTSEVLRNDGGGRYEVITDRAVITDENGMGQAIADFNNDGHLDWFVTAIFRQEKGSRFDWGESGNRLYLGTGEGLRFVNATEGSGVREGDWAWGACAADFNNDGAVDLFHENGYGSLPDYVKGEIPTYVYQYLPGALKPFNRTRPRLFINRGDGTFVESGEAWGLDEKTNGRGVVCVDYDRDGDIDLVAAQNADTPRVYENMSRGGESDGFIGFQLIGSQPNTRAIGALVTIEIGDKKQVRPVLANSNFQGQNPSTLHFGVADAEMIDRVTIRWPDGLVESLQQIEAGRYYPVLHPDLREPAVVARLSGTEGKR